MQDGSRIDENDENDENGEKGEKGEKTKNELEAKVLCSTPSYLVFYERSRQQPTSSFEICEP